MSLDVDSGSLVAIYGARGSGKTTLLNVAAGIEAPDSGFVAIANQRLDALSRRQRLELRRKSVGWVDRDGPHDHSLPMVRYVALPLYRDLDAKRASSRARTALAALGAEGCADARWADLSEVQRALCAIAHATVRKPRLIVADDPTAGLGLLDRERICQVLCAVADGGAAVLTAMPDLAATLRAQRTLALMGGRLVSPERGPDDGAGEVVELPVGRSA